MSDSEPAASEGNLKKKRWGLPLYGQVLCWFFVNLGIVLLALEGVLHWQFGVGVKGLFASRTEERVREVAGAVAGELRVVGRSDWSSILGRLEGQYGVEFAVYGGDGRFLGGERMEEVEGELDGFLPERKGEDRPRGRGRPGPPGGPDDFLEDEFFPGPEGIPDPGPRPDSRPRPNPEAVSGDLFGKMTSGNGTQWAWCPIGLGNQLYRHPPTAILVIRADKGEGSSVFSDFRPLVRSALGLIVLSGLLWLPFVYRVKRRLKLMTTGTERISQGDFSVKVASERRDEIGRLSRAIERMAGRLDVLVSGQKRFLGDTAHELCGPLARMRMGLGVLENRLEGTELERLKAVEEDVAELARLVDELLDFSKASLGAGSLQLADCAIRDLCVSVCGKEAIGKIWSIKGGEGLTVRTNRRLLQRAIGNVVRNAARYGGSEPLEVVVESHGKEVWIGVLDRGPGLPEGWTEKVFEPFSRPEAARTREGGGAGLGLAIVKACAESLGGRVFCRNRRMGGLEVVIVIPRG